MRRLTFLISVILLAACGSESSHTLLTRLDKEQTGIDFENTLFDDEPMNVLNYIYFYNGAGVAIGDINNDGLPDILFTGNMVHNRLYLNKGNFKFENITEQSGIATAAYEGWATGATMVDINGDGKLDIYICRSADGNPSRRQNLLFINNGNLSFTEKAAEYGLADRGYSTQAAFFDYDKDGDLDMFLINHSLHKYASGVVDNPGWRKERQAAYECKLFRNDPNPTLGHPVYTDVSAQAGISSNVLTFGLGLAVSDLNNDGWPDIYVSNDFNEPDYLFINNGNGSFTESLNRCMDQTSLYSMGNDAADFNNDGFVDLITLDMLPEDNHTQKMHSGAENFNKFQALFGRGFYYQYSRNMLQKNNGDGTFSEIAQLSGVSNTDWSWAPLFTDLDNDGNKDLLVTNGYVKDYTDMDFLKYSADEAQRGATGSKEEAVKATIAKMPASPGTSYLYRNNGDNTFTRSNEAWGLTQKVVSAGAAYVDLDNDGALDLVISNTNAPAGVYRNNARAQTKSHYLKIRLQGTALNPGGIGAKVKIWLRDTLLYQEAFPVRGFQSSVDPILNFGVGTHAHIDSLMVIWPDDKFQVLHPAGVDTMLTLKSGDAAGKWEYRRTVAPIFKPQSDLAPVHTDNAYNDFDIQQLLPHYLSRGGPCMASADIDGDGRPDIFIGGSKGHPAQVFLQTGQGRLIPASQPAIAKDSLSDDGAATFLDADGDGDADLLVADGGYAESPAAARLYLNDGKGHFSRSADALPRELQLSASCVRAADVDGDGDLDLFIGGRVVPRKFPLSPGSHLLLNDGKGHFTDATETKAPILGKLGMVTDAVWIDLDKDDHPELVIVGEWMPVTVLANRNGSLQDASAQYIRFPSRGWWTRIQTADLNGDGLPDLVLGNQGLNNQFQASSHYPLDLYYKDFNHNGFIDPIFCYYIAGTSYPAASRDDLTSEIPSLKKKFLEYHDYADATIEKVFSAEDLQSAGHLQTDTLASCWLENKGAGSAFAVRPLPQEAQSGPVYAIAAGDFDGDGKTDLLLAGGTQWTRIRFGRYYADHGVLLKGDGKGGFRYVPQPESGLQLRGDIRGVVSLGRSLVFGVNNGAAMIYGYK